ncbi:hypothetical protein HaLaN_32729, partial [Haematococcus lacustris]
MALPPIGKEYQQGYKLVHDRLPKVPSGQGACKFWNTAKLSHSDLLMRVIKADVELGRSCQTSWSAQFQLAVRELMG